MVIRELVVFYLPVFVELLAIFQMSYPLVVTAFAFLMIEARVLANDNCNISTGVTFPNLTPLILFAF